MGAYADRASIRRVPTVYMLTIAYQAVLCKDGKEKTSFLYIMPSCYVYFVM